MASNILDDRLSKIPTELLLEITSYLHRDDQWSFAWAFPLRPQLMLPILTHLSLSNYHPGPGEVADITNILDFLFRFPEFAYEIHQLYFYMDSDYPIRNTRVDRWPPTIEFQELVGPKKLPYELLGYAVEGEFTIMQWLSKRVEVNEDHLLPWATADEFQQARGSSEVGETVANIAKLTVLLALGTKIRNINIIVPHKYQTGCDLAHAAALAPAFRCFQHRGQILHNFVLSGDAGRGCDTDMYHRNLGTFFSSLFVVGHIKHLELKHIVESMCYRGEWSLYTGVVVDRLSIMSCVLRDRTFPRLLHAVNGLQHLDAHFSAPKSEHQLHMRPRLMHETRAPDRRMIRNDVQRGLKLHCRTLRNLEIRNFPIDLSFLTNTTRFYLAELRLKSKELSLTPLRTLPQSVHTLILSQKHISTWLEFLALLVVEMKQQNVLPNLMHVIEKRPKSHMPKFEQDIRSLGIQFFKCERPVTKDYVTAFKCQGECGLTRAGNLKHENC